MEVDKFKEDFFVEIPFKSLFIEPLPNESVLHRKRLDIAEYEDTSDSSKVFIDVRAIIATVDKGFVQCNAFLAFIIISVSLLSHPNRLFSVSILIFWLNFTSGTVSIRHSEV